MIIGLGTTYEYIHCHMYKCILICLVQGRSVIIIVLYVHVYS